MFRSFLRRGPGQPTRHEIREMRGRSCASTRPAALALAVVAGLLAAGCSSAPPPPYKPVADVKTLMEHIMDPVADQYWGAVGIVIDETGEHEIVPQTAEEWDAVRNAAYIVAESGNLLMMPSRAKDGGEWMQAARRLVDTAETAMRAAEARDKTAVFDRGAEMYDACVNCHVKYSPDIVNAAK